VGEVMFAIRNIAVREGNIPHGIVAQGKSLFETGRVINPIRSMADKRESLGLTKTGSGLEDVQKILRKTEFDKAVSSR